MWGFLISFSPEWLTTAMNGHKMPVENYLCSTLGCQVCKIPPFSIVTWIVDGVDSTNYYYLFIYFICLRRRRRIKRRRCSDPLPRLFNNLSFGSTGTGGGVSCRVHDFFFSIPHCLIVLVPFIFHNWPKMGEAATWQPGAWEFRCYVFSTENDDTMVCVWVGDGLSEGALSTSAAANIERS